VEGLDRQEPVGATRGLGLTRVDEPRRTVVKWPATDRSSSTTFLVLANLVVLAALALTACGSGGSSTPPTDLPTRTTPVAAVTFPAEQKPESGGTGGSTGGLEFVPWVDIEVSALGYFDHGQDGLRNDHKVVIWDYDAVKTVTPTVIVTSASVLDGQFRYEPIAPVVLKAGTHYVVAFLGDMDGDPGTDPKGEVWAPEIRFVGWRERDGSWGFPSGTWNFLDVSGNFKFLPVPVASSSPTP
jgi:hypothetical protein